jgi:hypothetical protein
MAKYDSVENKKKPPKGGGEGGEPFGVHVPAILLVLAKFHLSESKFLIYLKTSAGMIKNKESFSNMNKLG